MAIDIDKNDGALKLFARNLREFLRRLLIGRVIDRTLSQNPPSFHPTRAKMTVAIPNHERLGRCGGNVWARLLDH